MFVLPYSQVDVHACGCAPSTPSCGHTWPHVESRGYGAGVLMTCGGASGLLVYSDKGEAAPCRPRCVVVSSGASRGSVSYRSLLSSRHSAMPSGRLAVMRSTGSKLGPSYVSHTSVVYQAACAHVTMLRPKQEFKFGAQKSLVWVARTGPTLNSLRASHQQAQMNSPRSKPVR